MKKQLLKGLAVIASMIALTSNAQVRFIDPVFQSVSKTANVEYDSNAAVNILFGQGIPGIGPLFSNKSRCDIYQPTGDTAAKRPLIILAHTGSFLPAIVNRQVTGNKNDSSIVEIATNLAKRGFVVAAIDYRTGWNANSTVQADATEQLLKATFRGMQDSREAVRFLRKNASTYKIDTSMIILGGQGTGGYIAYGVATVNTRGDIENNAKFKRGNLTPMVSMDTLGDWTGIGGYAPLNYGADATTPSNIHMIFNWGGAMGDINWMKANSLPMVSLQCSNDFFAPYKTGNVIVPTTGMIVIPNASGAGDVIPKANATGLNTKINSVGYTDAVSARGLVVGKGENNLFAFEGNFLLDNAPWEFWNRTIVQAIPGVAYQGAAAIGGVIPANGRAADSISYVTNPTMSAAKGKAYCDTIVRFVAPRIAQQFGITGPLTLNPFNLIAPANNTIISTPINEVDSQAVLLKWTKSHVAMSMPGGTIYTVSIGIDSMIAMPLISVPLPGMDSIAVSQRQIYQMLKAVGATQGSNKKFYWRVVASNPSYSRSSAIYSITLTMGTLVEKVDLSSFVTVYPNPAKDQITVAMDNGKSPIASITVIDIAGREVLNMNNLNVLNQTIQTNGMGQGVYFMNLKTANGSIASKKFMVQ